MVPSIGVIAFCSTKFSYKFNFSKQITKLECKICSMCHYINQHQTNSIFTGKFNFAPWRKENLIQAAQMTRYQIVLTGGNFLLCTYSVTASSQYCAYPSLILKIFPRGFTFMSLCVRTNSPIA